MKFGLDMLCLEMTGKCELPNQLQFPTKKNAFVVNLLKLHDVDSYKKVMQNLPYIRK